MHPIQAWHSSLFRQPLRAACEGAAMSGVILAIDYGERRIGVALGNTVSRTARPLATITHASSDERFAKIQALLNEWQPQQLVVGLPLHPDGTRHEMTARCERFANQLRGRFGLPVALVDERYTSVIAQREGAADVDAHAAALILESFLQSYLQQPGSDNADPNHHE
jgi:putative Holliday junction resolvase